jgi:hypothetical protein
MLFKTEAAATKYIQENEAILNVDRNESLQDLPNDD